MGMSSHVIAFKASDEKWKKMKAVYDSCEKAGISIPEEIREYFNWTIPSEVGVEINIDHICEKYAPHDMGEGFKIEISKLPKDVTHVCFWNAY